MREKDKIKVVSCVRGCVGRAGQGGRSGLERVLFIVRGSVLFVHSPAPLSPSAPRVSFARLCVAIYLHTPL